MATHSRVLGPYAADSNELADFLAHNDGEFNGANTIDGGSPTENDASWYVWIDQRVKVGPFSSKEERDQWVRAMFFRPDEDKQFADWIYNDEA
jgi:hypothetical protein